MSNKDRSKRKRRRSRPNPTLSSVKFPPFLTRKVPPYEVLSTEALEFIEDQTDILLQEVGVDFRGDPETLEIWREAGASVDGERVRFDKGMLRQIIQKTAPKQFTQYARNPERSVQIGGDNLVFVPTYGPPFVQSREFGRRYATLEDLHNFIKLAYMSPYLHHSGGVICEPTDIPVTKRHLDLVYGHMRYSDKPFMGAVTSKSRAEDTMEMAKILFGADFLDANCCVVGLINANSPLVIDDTMLAALKVYARHNQAVTVTPFIIPGATGPVTVAASLVQGLAETMAGVALTQLVRPGAPVMSGFLSTATNMQSGAPSRGPEPQLGLFGYGQLARRLGIPFRAGTCTSTSKVADAQAMREATSFMNSSVLCGSNFLIHSAGGMEGGLATGYEKFMMDIDNLGFLQRFVQGIDVNEAECGLEAFREIGPGEHYFSSAHTMDRYRTAFYTAATTDSQSFEQWQEAGKLDAAERAHALWKKQLANYEAPALDPAIDEALQAFIERRKREIPDGYE